MTVARQSISRIITALAEAEPERVVAIDDDRSLTAVALDRESNRLARDYASRGVGQDDLVTVSLPNTVEVIVVCAAIWKLGATPQPVSTGLDARERAELGRLAGARLIVGYESADPSLPWVDAGHLPDPSLSDEPLDDAWAASWKAPTSSGSTGRPKIVIATAPALLDASQPVAAFLPLGGVHLVAGPLVHSATFTYSFRALLTGARLVILPRFDERRVLAAIGQHRVTWMLVVPTMMHRLLRLPVDVRAAADLSSLETVLHLGAPCAPELKRAFVDWLVEAVPGGADTLVELYAGSESNGLVMIRGGEWLGRPGSVGLPIGGTEVTIRALDDPSRSLPVGSTGLIWMRRQGSPTYRYLGGSSRRDPEGWDTLGDLGHVDADGYLFIADRADDVILRGGVNVLPTDIERVVEGHPSVRSAVAFGVPDDDLGQRIEVVVDVAGQDEDPSALLEWARSRLDLERRPSRVHVVHDPVRSDAGKTSRRAYASRFADR